MEAAGASQAEGVDAAAAVMAFSSRLHHDRQAKQAMISANYKLVVSICKKYQGYGMSMGDLINEGIAGGSACWQCRTAGQEQLPCLPGKLPHNPFLQGRCVGQLVPHSLC
jgi:hypothetical protein